MILPEIYTRSGYVRTPIYLRRLKKHGANILGDTVFSGICDVCMIFLIRLSHTLLNYKIKKQTKSAFLFTFYNVIHRTAQRLCFLTVAESISVLKTDISAHAAGSMYG